MRNLISRAVVCVLVLVTPGVTPVACASLLSPFEASALIQSTATDTDGMLLSLFYGFEAGQTLNYSASLTTTSWSGTLTGTYLGTGLSLTYLGDLSNYQSSGAVAWTNSGSYGNQSWSGSGSATIADTSSTTFQVSLSYSMMVGSNSASINYMIPGTVGSDGTIMYGEPGNEEVGDGTFSLNGTPNKNISKYSYKTLSNGLQIISDIRIFGKKRGFNNDYNTDEFRGIIIGPLTSSVPEPSSALLMGFGLLALMGMCVWQYRSVSARPATDRCPRNDDPTPTLPHPVDHTLTSLHSWGPRHEHA
jgi:hypothetical protein